MFAVNGAILSQKIMHCANEQKISKIILANALVIIIAFFCIISNINGGNKANYQIKHASFVL